jgi:arylsulfatase A-like enzyme
LIMRGPGVPKSTRVRSLAGLIDIVPTVLGLLGLPVEFELDGVDLAHDWRNVDTHPVDRELMIETSWIDGTRAKRGIRTRQQKLILNLDSGEPEFYDLREDPAEQMNLYPTEEATLLERRLVQADHEVEAGEVVLSADDIEQLKSLGYID